MSSIPPRPSDTPASSRPASRSSRPPAEHADEGGTEASPVDRRDFLRAAGAGAGLLLLGGCDPGENPRVPGLHPRRRIPFFGGSSANVVVIGAGAFGGWTALHLRQMGAKVTLVDAYGPGNSRSTSGDETRGVRSSYGDRDSGELWMLWAREAMKRWKAWDDEWGRDFKLNLFHTTGDIMLRAEWEPFLVKTKGWWDKHKVPYEVLKPEEVRYRWPVIALDDVSAVLVEPDAGVVRARWACHAVSAAFEKLGGRIVIGRAHASRVVNGRLEEIELDSGEKLRADTFVFACGPWLGKVFPDLLANRMRTPLGYVCYFGPPAGDMRFTYPNLPSFNFPGVTGWPALPADSRGFRVRGSLRAPNAQRQGAAGAASGAGGAPSGAAASRGGGGASNGAAGNGSGRGADTTRSGTRAGGRGGATSSGGAGAAANATPSSQLDPDLSDRWLDAGHIEGPRRFLAARFPILKDAPVLQTHACHYELTSSRNFIVDRHPRMSNVWIAGGGNAEGFKFGPVMGEYVAQRVLGQEGNAEVAKGFHIPKDEFQAPTLAGTPATPGARADSAKATSAADTGGAKPRARTLAK